MTWVIAHRGASRDFPENTLRAFDAALERGADGLELDVQLTRDGVPVIWHDRTLARAGAGRARVVELTRSQVARLDVRGERIPTLDEVLDRYGDLTRLLIEIKARPGAEPPEHQALLVQVTAARLRRRPPRAGAHVLCFQPWVLGWFERQAPELPRVLNYRPGRTLPDALARRLGSLSALSVDVRTLRAGFATAVRGAGCPLFVYTCNTAREVTRALACGAAAVMSDRPEWLAPRVRRAEARS